MEEIERVAKSAIAATCAVWALCALFGVAFWVGVAWLALRTFHVIH
ncbi:hypothetical protein [Trebonia kvetii]|nr:hypothetical protein [Trebonia kvetii]